MREGQASAAGRWDREAGHHTWAGLDMFEADSVELGLRVAGGQGWQSSRPAGAVWGLAVSATVPEPMAARVSARRALREAGC